MPKLQLDIKTDVAPEKITSALIDFSDKRPEIWPGMNAKQYEVYEVGETTALIREGSGGPIWAKERYDWSKPGTVRWEVVESGFCKPGGYVQVDISPDGTGSKIHLAWERNATTLLGKVALQMIVLTRGAPIKASIKRGLDKMRSGA